MMDGDTFGFGKRVSQFKERDVRFLQHQFAERANMSGQFASTR